MTWTEALLRNFLVRSDVEAALFLLNHPKRHCSPAEIDRFKKYIEINWPGYFDEHEYKRIYNVAGTIEAENNQAYDNVPLEFRFQTLVRIFNNLNLDREFSVFDFGCSRGIWATHLSKTFGGYWTLLDIDKFSIHGAMDIVKKHSTPECFDFHIGTEDDEEFKDKHKNKFEVGLILEVLEHVKDYQKVVDFVESTVIPGGNIIISVPLGPFEYTTWILRPTRNREHIREFDFEGLIEIFGQKKLVSIQYIHYAKSKTIPLDLGHFFVTYKKSEAPTGTMNLERKCNLTSPGLWPLPGFE